MKHIKDVLTKYGIDNVHIENLLAFESRDGFTVLDKEEFESMQDYFTGFPVYKFLVPIVTDSNSNYWCLYVDGPLKNMMCYLSHDDLSLEPRFKSLSSLLDAVHNHPESYEMYEFEDDAFDYPSRKVSATQSHENEIIAQLYKIFEAEKDDHIRTQTAFSIMALTSPTDIEKIIYPFLDDHDMYVQERAIEMLGFHKYQPALQKLTELTTTAQHNGKTAAKAALKKLAAH